MTDTVSEDVKLDEAGLEAARTALNVSAHPDLGATYNLAAAIRAYLAATKPPLAGEVTEALQEVIRALNITDEELLRQRNYCEYAGDGKIKVWAVFLQKLIDHIRELRTLAASRPKEDTHAE